MQADWNLEDFLAEPFFICDFSFCGPGGAITMQSCSLPSQTVSAWSPGWGNVPCLAASWQVLSEVSVCCDSGSSAAGALSTAQLWAGQCHCPAEKAEYLELNPAGTHWARSNGLGRSHTEITWRLVRAWQRSLEGQGGRQRVQPWMRWAVPTGGCHSSATLPHCPGTVAQLHSADGLCYPNTGLLLIPPLMFIMVILKLPAMNEPLKDWDQHKGRVKLSVPHSTHCFKGLSRAQSYSGVR